MNDEYYGTLRETPVFEGISRYCQPFNYELAGKRFHLVMDRDNDYDISFIDGHYLEWSESSAAPQKYYYECEKADETSYLVNFELRGAIPRMGYSLIVDMEQRLVTLVKARARFSEKYPNMVDSAIDFGAIALDGYPLPKIRHGYTADLVGKRIKWVYSPEFVIIHVYYHPNYVRATFPPGIFEKVLPTPEARESWNKNTYDERAAYIKIKKNMYLVEIIEQNSAKAGWTGNSLLFLMDLERVHDVGRSFGNHRDPKDERKIVPENYMFAAYGDFVESDFSIEAGKSMYLPD
jgi:hypothetical protein